MVLSFCVVFIVRAQSPGKDASFTSKTADAPTKLDDDLDMDGRGHESCPPFCRGTERFEGRSSNDDGNSGEDGHAQCQPSCRERDHRIEVEVHPQFAALAAGRATHFEALTNDPTGVTWSATVGTIDTAGNYVAPLGAESLTATVTATSRKDLAKAASATIHVVVPGQITPTSNPQVAIYSISPGAAGNVFARFGPDTNYELKTWKQPVPVSGGAVSLFVAGMRGDSTYHIQGHVEFTDGSEFTDFDQSFVAGPPPALQLPTTTATTTPGLKPQSGVELLDLLPLDFNKPGAQVVVTDLSGNNLWTYAPAFSVLQANPVKLLRNGHFLINFSAQGPDGANSVLQEVDLGGSLIWQMTAVELNAALAAATCSGCNITVLGTHHDFVQLSNSHLIVIAAIEKDVSGTMVTGDVVIDLDASHKPVWVWNAFDHLEIDRRPMDFPDWTHVNAVLYSADDGNLIISSRHQNWLIKIDYENGTGNGDVLWKLGYQGDFALVGGTDPTDWFYAQHGPSFVSKNTAGNFARAVFDKGNDRVFPPGAPCDSEEACFYSTAMILQIDEIARTATLVFHPHAPSGSYFGGNAEVLHNGDFEYDQTVSKQDTSSIFELLPQSSPQIVWQMLVAGRYVYRGQRIASLYPGVRW